MGAAVLCAVFGGIAPFLPGMLAGGVALFYMTGGLGLGLGRRRSGGQRRERGPYARN